MYAIHLNFNVYNNETGEYETTQNYVAPNISDLETVCQHIYNEVKDNFEAEFGEIDEDNVKQQIAETQSYIYWQRGKFEAVYDIWEELDLSTLEENSEV